eukprot:10063502-Karenia_brevis.AAC.1
MVQGIFDAIKTWRSDSSVVATRATGASVHAHCNGDAHVVNGASAPRVCFADATPDYEIEAELDQKELMAF